MKSICIVDKSENTQKIKEKTSSMIPLTPHRNMVTSAVFVSCSFLPTSTKNVQVVGHSLQHLFSFVWTTSQGPVVTH